MTGERPYIGLRYFEDRDAHLYYGRDEHVAELIGKLAQNRFVAVVGASGSGKSSLVRAGLLPELRSGMIPSAGHKWVVVEYKPGRNPLGELAAAIDQSVGASVAAHLVEEGPLGIPLSIDAARIGRETNVLVIADQFEELFRFEKEEASQGRGEEAGQQSQALVRRLLDAASQTDRPVYVLLVMRSDYLGDCAQFPELPERMSESLYVVPRLRRDQLEETITAPVGGQIEAAVVQRLLSEVGSDPDQLPRLQHLLGRMWDHANSLPLTMADYEACGGWAEALTRHLEETYSKLSPGDRAVCASVFRQLSELDRGRPIRRRAEIGELTAVCGGSAESVVQAFVDAGFLVRNGNFVDATHECILRNWPRLREWLAQEQLDAKRLQELTGHAAQVQWRPGRTDVAALEGLTLETLAQWNETAKPRAEWAGRYVTQAEFQAGEDYLAWSVAQEQLKKERVRQLERQALEATAEQLRRTRKRFLMASVLAAALALAGLEFYREKIAAQRSEEAQKEAIQQGNRAIQALADARTQRDRAIAAKIDITRRERGLNLNERGWSVVFAKGVDAASRSALAPLLSLRKSQAGAHYKEMEYRPEESGTQLLARYGAESAPVDPIPYYILLVGNAEQIPFSVQYQLATQYGVGRITFETPAEYKAYAQTVIRADKHEFARQRQAVMFGPTHKNDGTTRMLESTLFRPIADSFKKDPNNLSEYEWQLRQVLREQATKSRLKRIIGGDETPAVLFVGGNGLQLSPDDPKQRDATGAILCADYPGPGVPANDDQYYAAADVPADAQLKGMIALLYSSFSAGTPKEDDFVFTRAGATAKDRRITIPVSVDAPNIAPAPLVAKLPSRMLGLSSGGALAVIGHVDKNWSSSSLRPENRSGMDPKLASLFATALRRLMNGQTVGFSMEPFRLRSSSLTTFALGLITRPGIDDSQNANRIENSLRDATDARNFIVFGDPAASVDIPLDELARTGK